YREKAGEIPGLSMPRGVPALRAARGLTMERMPGQELLEGAKGAPQEDRDRVGTQLFDILIREFFLFGLMQTDPNPANYLFDDQSGALVLLDFGACREVPEHVASLYRSALRGIALQDRSALEEFLDELGVLELEQKTVVEPDSKEAKQRARAQELFINIALTSSECFAHGPYDFGASTLPQRITTLSMEFKELRKVLRPPAPEFIFFQRKLAGTFLLCRQLGARVDCRAVFIEHGLLDEEQELESASA
ncbi:MAG: AarF/UbiB family protein, partial [Polyangiaceae bacterium]|nr:AarF/UbiB family protein [Polyangiaceae bacterium]